MATVWPGVQMKPRGAAHSPEHPADSRPGVAPNRPDGHALHTVAPMTSLYWPAGHDVGEDMPAAGQTAPSGHGVHDPKLPFVEKVPGAQSTPVGRTAPAAHTLPAALVQAPKHPAEVRGGAPLGPYLPAGQARHTPGTPLPSL